MKKQLLFTAFTVLALLGKLNAQSLFYSPDTVCVGQKVSLFTYDSTSTNYYWSFCSGSIDYAPTGVNLGDHFGSYTFRYPDHIETAKDNNGNYYGFVVNTTTDELYRLNYGNSLTNTPTITNFGNMTKALPHHPSSLYIYHSQDIDSSWYVFVTGGFDASESSLARIDFGHSLSNPAPNIANFGNLQGMFNNPRGVFVDKDVPNGVWFGYVLNKNSSELIRLDFQTVVSHTPVCYNMGNPGGYFNHPNDMAVVFDQNKWHLFIANTNGNNILRVDMRAVDTLDTTVNMGNFLYRVLEPSSISLTRDCGNIYAYITDSSTSQLVSLRMQQYDGPYYPVDYSVVGGMNYPTCVSNIIRDRDNLYAFITNAGDSSLTRINLTQCRHSSIPSFSEIRPPLYSYDTPGWYNVYFVIDDGLPTMRTECKQITVLPTPNMILTAPSTICKGDSIRLWAISNYADTVLWTNNFNIDTVYNNTDTVHAWPDYTTNYTLHFHFPDGCTVDTMVQVRVIKVVADAGPDRVIADGATTTLGGPNTTMSDIPHDYNYTWSPTINLNQFTSPFVDATLSGDQSYVLLVSHTDGASGKTCSASDTVVVRVNCGDFNVPNAFNPNSSNSMTNRFGPMNKQIGQLTYFRVFDRWGSMVFETTDITKQWDGTFNGTPCPTGVYIWEAAGYCESGKALKKHGNVTLMR